MDDHQPRMSRTRRKATSFALLPITIYRKFISPLIAPRCKYYPSCSAYAVMAIQNCGILKGYSLTVWRLLRCNPWSHGGVDYPPQKKIANKTPNQEGHEPNGSA